MQIVCSDLEGVFAPEIWINVSKKTGIDELKLTTRDISDYNLLMKRRLEILKENNITLQDIQYVISTLKPMPGARDMLNWLRNRIQVVIVSDTFTEFAGPLMRQLDYPTIFCNSLVTDSNGMITDYKLRQPDGKRRVAEALQSLNYKVIGIGDSYNDISMLRQSDTGILFSPPENVMKENSDLKVARTYHELKDFFNC
ncbi:MAG: bifunctional phosphoserine phosphatase/homoserine phosphotransferase ThrH [Chloroflexota bacterium]